MGRIIFSSQLCQRHAFGIVNLQPAVGGVNQEALPAGQNIEEGLANGALGLGVLLVFD